MPSNADYAVITVVVVALVVFAGALAWASWMESGRPKAGK